VRGASGINWDALLEAAIKWSEEAMSGLEPGEGHANYGLELKAAADVIYKDPTGGGSAAQIECPFGFLFLCTTQVLASAMRLTGAFEPWSRALDKMLAELPFFSVSGSKWPTYRMLAMFASLSKGNSMPTLGDFQADVHRWGGIHPVSKRFRQYGDLRLTELELCPFGRNIAGWNTVDSLALLSPDEWYVSLAQRRLGSVRPVMAEALDAAMHVVRSSVMPGKRECGFSGITPEACADRGCRCLDAGQQWSHPLCIRKMPQRKVVGVTFVWGEQWSHLVPRFAAWASKLGMGAVVVAMGEACRRSCESALAGLGGRGASSVACWDPLRSMYAEGTQATERGSILQRHAMVHLLLHLGVDVVAFDFDTFFFSDPRPRLEAISDQHSADVLMTRHLDADCLNMGLLYIRASSHTAGGTVDTWRGCTSILLKESSEVPMLCSSSLSKKCRFSLRICPK